MSVSNVELCSLIVKERFGETVCKIATYLMRNGVSTIGMIIQETKTNAEQVKISLAILVQHNIVHFEQNKRGIVEYSADTDTVLCSMRYIRYIYCAKTLYGDAAELLVEHLLHHGQSLMSDAVVKVTDRLNDALESSGNPTIDNTIVREKFASLVKTQFLQRCPNVERDSNKKVTSLVEMDSSEMFILPAVDMEDTSSSRKRKRENDDAERQVKKHKTEGSSSEAPDAGIYWCLHFDRFHLHFRDQLFIKSIERKIDRKAAEVVRSILRVSETRTEPTSPITVPINLTKMLQAVPKDLGFNQATLEQYLRVLTEDSSEFVSRVDESGGGMFSINIYQGLTNLCKAHIESVIQERYGSKGLRVFRVLLRKRHLEQKQIEDCAMVPAKEVKEILYTMFSDGFVKLTELSKTSDHAPARTFYLFCVDINAVARMLLERCYKATANAILRREFETKENKRLLDKQQRVEAIVSSLEQSGASAEQREEIEAMISPPERTQIEHVKMVTNKLDQSEVQLDETIFILQTYLWYSTLNTKTK